MQLLSPDDEESSSPQLTYSYTMSSFHLDRLFDSDDSEEYQSADLLPSNDKINKVIYAQFCG